MSTAADNLKQLGSMYINYVKQSTTLLLKVGSYVSDTAKKSIKGDIKQNLDPSKLVVKWIDFNLKVTSSVTEHSLAALKEIVSFAQKEADPSDDTDSGDDTKDKEVELQGEGRVNQTVTAPFQMQNQHDQKVEVEFRSTTLISENRLTLPPTHVTFSPPKASLNPGEQVIVKAKIKITKDFIVGETYKAKILILGSQAKGIMLAITILPKAENKKKDIKGKRNPS